MTVSICKLICCKTLNYMTDVNVDLWQIWKEVVVVDFN
jgi:hypothetical protein